MNIEKKVKEAILLGGLHDWIDLIILIEIVQDDLKKPEDEVMIATLDLIKEYVEKELIIIGNDCGGYFEKWDSSLEESLKRIRKEWELLGREPEQWEIVQFALTAKGKTIAKEIDEYYTNAGFKMLPDCIFLQDQKSNKQIIFYKDGGTYAWDGDRCSHMWTDFDSSSYHWDEKRSVWQRVDENGIIWYWDDDEDDWIIDKNNNAEFIWSNEKQKWFFPSTVEIQNKAKERELYEIKTGSLNEDKEISVWSNTYDRWVCVCKNGNVIINKGFGNTPSVYFDASSYKWDKLRRLWLRVDEDGKTWYWDNKKDDWSKLKICTERCKWDEKKKKWYFPSTRKLQEKLKKKRKLKNKSKKSE